MVQLFHCSFRTGKGLGYSAHFSGPMLVLECAVKTGKKENKVLHHLVKFEFHPQKVKISCNTIYNIASKFVLSNSIVLACFTFLLCTLMTSANKSLEKEISIGLKMLKNNWFIRQLCVYQDMKQLGNLESTQEARRIFLALQTSCVLHILMNAC